MIPFDLPPISVKAGNSLTWSDHYRIETEDETFQDGEYSLYLDFLLDLSR